MDTSFEAAIPEDVEVSGQADENVSIQRGVYLVRTLSNERGETDGAILWKLDRPAAPIRLSRAQYKALQRTKLFEEL